MSKQPIGLLLVKIELLSKTMLHRVTPNSNNTNWDNRCSKSHSTAYYQIVWDTKHHKKVIAKLRKSCVSTRIPSSTIDKFPRTSQLRIRTFMCVAVTLLLGEWYNRHLNYIFAETLVTDHNISDCHFRVYEKLTLPIKTNVQLTLQMLTHTYCNLSFITGP